MIEQWKPILEYPAYSVSNMGRVRLDIDRHKSKAGFEPQQEPDVKGYMRVALCNGGNHRRYVSVHRLVAKAFLPNPLNLPTVNHKNGIKWWNMVDNLEWSSYNRQMYHAQQTGLRAVKGYYYRGGPKPWRAQIEMGGRKHRKNISLGDFPTESEARVARIEAELKFQNMEVIP